jgi:hypothetical protein
MMSRGIGKQLLKRVRRAPSSDEQRNVGGNCRDETPLPCSGQGFPRIGEKTNGEWQSGNDDKGSVNGRRVASWQVNSGSFSAVRKR